MTPSPADGLPLDALMQATIAGILACLACGLGALPLAIKSIDPARHRGLGYAVAGGLMFAASVYNLILPALQMGQSPDEFQIDLVHIGPILIGILLGAGFLALTDRYLDHDHEEILTPDGSQQPTKHYGWGGRVGLLVLIAMTVHSIPEGVAVGTGYTSDAAGLTNNLGPVLALAIGIHNIPEGLAVAIPLRAAGASIWRCFWAAVLTSVPQPIAAVPAVLLAWFFQPLMPLLMGFAAGAMIFLIVLELIPHALEEEKPTPIAWAFTLGFCAMLLVQVVL
ncbi:ZIP family metal transporter [Mucisphaera sp.]|uniref:ZIP family metal transporter n=1 Tax=Mucisphaera sp. TaxID=2913024 RepID=UPI003D1324FC